MIYIHIEIQLDIQIFKYDDSRVQFDNKQQQPEATHLCSNRK